MLLSLDTCGTTGSVALGRDSGAPEAEILAAAELAGRTYSVLLVSKIGEMLTGQQATMRDIEAIVVVNGPGSFTGIRVGLSAAKGLAEATGIPLIAISRLALLAYASGLPHVLAVMDAGRGEVYTGEYHNGQCLGEALLSGVEIVAAASRPGAGLVVCQAGSAGTGDSSSAAIAECGAIYVQPPDAAAALQLAFPRFRARDFDNVETLDANYLRRSDAELFRIPGREGAAR